MALGSSNAQQIGASAKRGTGLTCTELCACSDEDKPCENTLQEDDGDEYIDDNDEKGNSYDNASDDDEGNSCI